MAWSSPRLAVPRLADWCAVELAGRDGGGARARAPRRGAGARRRRRADPAARAARASVGVAARRAARAGARCRRCATSPSRSAPSRSRTPACTRELQLRARRARGDPRRRRRRGDRAGRRRAAALRQRRRRAAARRADRARPARRCSPPSRRSSPRASSCSTRTAGRSRSSGCPAGIALAGVEPEPVDRRATASRATGEERWVARQGAAAARPGRHRHARHQRGRGHHRPQAGRGDAAAARRGGPRARRLARLRGDAAQRRPAARARRWPTGAWSTCARDRGLERVAVAHADPACAALAAGLHGLLIDPAGTEGPARRRPHRPLRAPRATSTPAHIAAAARNPRHHELLAQLGVRSALSVPMTLRGAAARRAHALRRRRRAARSAPEQLELAEEFARRAAVAVDNAPRRTGSARRSPARCRTRCCRPRCPRSPGIETARAVPPGRRGRPTSAATSTTSSTSPRTSGSR